MPRLYVAMYKPVTGNYEHWALYLEDNDNHKLFQVVGAHPTFTDNVTIAKSASTERHKRSIFISDINTIDLEELGKAVGAVVPDNSIVPENYQDYIIEVLEKFEEECIVDADEEAYIGAKKELMEHYGPP